MVSGALLFKLDPADFLTVALTARNSASIILSQYCAAPFCGLASVPGLRPAARASVSLTRAFSIDRAISTL